MLTRRNVLAGGAALGGLAALSPLFPAWAQSGTAGIPPQMPTLSGDELQLTVGHMPYSVGGRTGHAVTVNGTLPAPLLRFREGQNVRIAVTNNLDEDTSIHWHGLIVPFQMDGVPGVSFPGIRPGETFRYEFPIRQSGTYWYHSHSGMQEQQGHYGPLILDPAEPDPVAYDREHVVILSDWSFLHPHQIVARLRQQAGYFNRNRMTLAGRMSGDPEQVMPQADRAMFARMRMDPTDILDVSATTYTYLINGHGPLENWTGLFRPGERVRLRIINAASMTIFNVRIPGLPMMVVSADGQNVRPVAVDEFQIGNAETYDVIVQPVEDKAFTLVAEAMDRSGLARATLAPRAGMSAPVPPLRRRPVLGMRDMGMDMSAGGHGSAGAGHDMAGMDHGQAPANQHGARAADPAMAGMSHDMRDAANAPQVRLGPGVDMIAPMPQDRTGDPGLGLENEPHKVLTYRDLVALAPGPDRRLPARTVEIHLTGNMERFMWSFDGVRQSEGAEPIRLERNERVRLKLVNDSMMTHPIHLHGHFFEVVNGQPGPHPRKHTVNVLPGGVVKLDLTADAPGDWAFHCHMLLHMHAGMMRVVTVRPLEGGRA